MVVGQALPSRRQRPGREHDTTALRTHAEILPALTIWTADDRPVLGDLGYEGEAEVIAIAFKTPTGGELTDEQKEERKHRRGGLGTQLGRRGSWLTSVHNGLEVQSLRLRWGSVAGVVLDTMRH